MKYKVLENIVATDFMIYLLLAVLIVLVALLIWQHLKIRKMVIQSDKSMLHRELEDFRNNTIVALEIGSLATWSYDCVEELFYMLDGGHEGNYTDKGIPRSVFLTNYIHPSDKAGLVENLDRVGKGEVDKVTHTFRFNIAGEWRWILTSVTPIKVDGVITSLLGIRRDVTAEMELQKLNDQKELIFNNMSSILVYINKEFEVQWSNSHHILGKDYGYIYEQGTKCYASFGLDSPCQNCPAVQAMRSGRVINAEFDMIPNGKIYESTATVIKSKQGVEGVVLKLDNTTELKQLITELESTNQFMSLLVEELPTPFFVKDINNGFKYIFASSIFCDRIANKPREEIIGCTDYEIFDDLEAANKFRRDDLYVINHCSNKVVNIGEEHVINNSGESFVETRKLHLKLPNNRSYLIGQASDVTEIRKINEQLMIAKEKAEEAGKLKSAFLANMSHEIRTPLNAIVGFSELLKYSTDMFEREEYMNIIDTNNELLLQLVGDILDLSRIESGSIELAPETFDFSAFFQETYVTLKPRCEKRGVELRKEIPFNKCMVTLDKHRCLQVLTNYLNNAVKFTSKGYIEMGYNYERNGVVIYVEDTGIGLSEDKKERLFQRFEKLNDFAQGTGLGLSICKAITEAMGGHVWAESEEGKGSIFFAWIPCEATIEHGRDATTVESVIDKRQLIDLEFDNPKKRILVAEDNLSNYMLVEALLSECDLTWARNGKEAVTYAQGQEYDAILMDLRMPVMGGLDATRMIREFDERTTIVAVTANAFESDRIEALRAGCNGFVTKPLKKKNLLEAIC